MARAPSPPKVPEAMDRIRVADPANAVSKVAVPSTVTAQNLRRRSRIESDIDPSAQAAENEKSIDAMEGHEGAALEGLQQQAAPTDLGSSAPHGVWSLGSLTASADTANQASVFESIFSSPYGSLWAQAAETGAATTGATGTAAGVTGSATAGSAAGAATAGAAAAGATASGAALVGAAVVAGAVSAAGQSSSKVAATDTTSSTQRMRVVDGPIKQAQIYIDKDNDGVIDPEDVRVGETDEQGYANLALSADQAGYGLIAKGGTDSETNKPFAGLMAAPKGSTVINPLTTLVAALMEGPSGKSLADAQTAVIAALGLTGVSDVTSYDAFEEAKAGTPSGLANHFKAIQVANIIVAGSAMVAGGGDTASAASSLIDALAGQINSTVGAVDLLNAQVLADVLTDAGANAGEVSAVASAIVAVNELIETAVQSAANGGSASQLMDDAVKAQVVAQVVLTGAIKQGNDGLLQAVASGAGDLAEAVDVGLVDNQAPSAPILSLAAGVSAEATSAAALAALTVKAEAGTLVSLSFMQGSIRIDKRITADGSDQSVEWTEQELDRLSDGSIEVRAFAVDSASNNGEEALLALELDLSAPQVNSVSDNIESGLTKDNITFTVTFSEALTGTVGLNNFTATNGTVTSVTRVGSTNAYTVLVTPTPGLASGSVALSVVGTGLADAAGNALANADLSSLASQAIDTQAPAVSSVTEATTADTTKDPITFTVTFSETLTGTVGNSSFTATDGAITSVTQVGNTNAYTVVVTPTAGLASGTVTLSLVGSGLADAAGNALANADLSSMASQAIGPLSPIDLGYYGKLIKPVTVDGGKTYYFWDRWNVNSADANDLTSADLFTSTPYFNSFFRYDASGAVNPGSDATATYRFASINGVSMALPTVGGLSSPTPTAVGHSDQTVGSTASNPDYDDYLAIWDAYNGTGTTTEASNLNGTPPGWATGGYWAADVETNGRKFVSLNSGSVIVNTSGSYPDGFKFAAVEVLSVSAISYRESSGLTLVVDGSSLSSPSHYVGTQEADRLTGGAGDDTLWGGPGDDRLKGGGGKDRFIFWIGDGISPALWPDVEPNSVDLSAGFDWIQDFGDGDSVELSHFYGYTKDTGSPALADRTYTVLRGVFNADTKIFGFDPLGKAALVIYDGNPSDDPDGLSAHFSSIVLTTSSAAGVPALDTSVQGVIRGDSTAATLSGTVPVVNLGTALAGSAGDSTGEALVLNVSFDGNVIGLSSGTNSSIFTVGGTGVSAIWSGSGNTRTLTYTIASGQNGQAAIDEAALKQALIAGLTDAAGNAFAYSGDIANIDANALPVIDTTGPALGGTAPALALGAALAGDAGNSTGETMTLTLNFDGNVIGLSSGTNSTIFTVGGAGVSAIWSGTGNTRTLTYTIAAGQNGQAAIDEAALKTALVTGITDAAGNAFAYSDVIASIDAGPASTPINFGLNTGGGVDGYQSVYLIPTDGLTSAVGQTVSSWSFASGGFGGQRSITPLLFESVGGNYVLRAIGNTQQAQGNTVYQDLAFNVEAGDARIANANYFFGWKDGTQTADNEGVISTLGGSPGYWTSQEYDGQDITSQTIGNSVWFRSQFDGRNYQFQVKTSGSALPVIDATAPSATLTTGASPNTSNATVQSSETGTAYLVKTGGASPITVTTLTSITGADGAKWNSVAISAANTATPLSLAGLEDGTYSLYTVDAAGNLSAAASNTYSVDGTAPVLDIQYAASATASSTFGQSPGTLWSIWQILGAPDTTHEDDGKAWAPLQANNPSGEWVEVGFSSPVYAEAVVIKEIYQHGFVTRLDLVDLSGNYHTVWQGVDPTLPSGPTGEWPVDFKINFPRTDYLVSKAKVYVNSLHGESWEQIESIGLVRQAWTVATSTLAGSAGDSTGETITLTLNFDGAVNGLSSGTNSSIFTVAGSGVNATWSGTGSTRTLTYTITAGQNGQAAIDEAALKTALIAGITDSAGNAFAYSGNIPNIDASALPVVDTRFDAAKDFVAGPTAQSANNIWQYFSADYASSNISNLQLLSNWDTNGNGLILRNQWDADGADDNYPFVQQQSNGKLIVHPDRADLDGTGKAVVVAWKNTTESNVTVDLTGSLSLVGDTLASFGSGSQTASDDGITYLVTTSASVGSTPSVLLQGSLDENSGTTTPSSTPLFLGGQVLAPGAMISVAVHRGGTYFWDHTQLDLQITPRPAAIDLGSYGQLIAPVQVEGKWYYHWDRNGDGTSAGDGYNKDPASSYPLSEIYGLFKQDINGVAGAATDETYRYAVINGVKLALPELGADLSAVNGGGYRAPGTSISGTQDNNTSYDGLFAIWDAHNGGQVGTGMSGMPPGWITESYVSATPFIKDWYAPKNEYAFIRTYDGLIEPHANWAMNVALQVL